MKSYAALIDLWPSANALARDLGAKPNTVRKWKTRDSIPAARWVEMVNAARRRKIKITADDFARIAARGMALTPSAKSPRDSSHYTTGSAKRAA